MGSRRDFLKGAGGLVTASVAAIVLPRGSFCESCGAYVPVVTNDLYVVPRLDGKQYLWCRECIDSVARLWRGFTFVDRIREFDLHSVSAIFGQEMHGSFIIKGYSPPPRIIISGIRKDLSPYPEFQGGRGRVLSRYESQEWFKPEFGFDKVPLGLSDIRPPRTIELGWVRDDDE